MNVVLKASSLISCAASKMFSETDFSKNRAEIYCSYMLFGMLTVLLAYFYTVTVWLHHLDTVFLTESLASIKSKGLPLTSAGQSFGVALQTFTLEAKDLCSALLQPLEGEGNVLFGHAYLVLYPLAVFTIIFPADVVLSIATALAFISIVALTFVFLRRRQIPFLPAGVFCALLILHPAFSHSALGNFYADRFFVPLALAYLITFHKIAFSAQAVTKGALSALLALGIASASTTERGAMMIMAFNISALVFFWNEIKTRKIMMTLSVFTIVLLLYVITYSWLIRAESAVGSYGSLLNQIPTFLNRLDNPGHAAGTLEFMKVNVLFFGILSVFNWRYAVIALIAMLPNILTTVGGAEKNGWATHYHTMYFPFLIFAAMAGFEACYRRISRYRYRAVLTVSVAALAVVISDTSPAYGKEAGVVTRLYNFYTYDERSWERAAVDGARRLNERVPPQTTVTTVDYAMPALYRNRIVYLYPVGIDAADYAFLRRSQGVRGEVLYEGAVSYVGQGQAADECLTERLRRGGFNVDSPEMFGDMALLKRVRRSDSLR